MRHTCSIGNTGYPARWLAAALRARRREQAALLTHIHRMRDILLALDSADARSELPEPFNRLPPLKGDRQGQWAVTVSRMWRIVFRVGGDHVLDVDLTGYHEEAILSESNGSARSWCLAAAPPVASWTAHPLRLDGGSAGRMQLDSEQGGAQDSASHVSPCLLYSTGGRVSEYLGIAGSEAGSGRMGHGGRLAPAAIPGRLGARVEPPRAVARRCNLF